VGIPGSVRQIATRWNQRENAAGRNLTARLSSAPVLWRFVRRWLLEEIARGGMGIVYKARQLSLDRVVAVKMLLTGAFGVPEFVQRFRIEAEAAASLHHPHIVPIHEFGQQEGQHYLVMDYVAGQNLSQLIRSERPGPRQAAQYLRSIAEAVHYAHGQGILHRDLKPSNILVDEQGQVQVTDFGLAKRLTSESDLTITGQAIGSPTYSAPEQVAGQRGEVGPHSDVYGMGAVLYELLTGRPPFVGETLGAVIQQVQEREVVSPRLLNPAVPKDLESICLKCLEKEWRRRYASAGELEEDLGRFLRGEPTVARPVRVWGRARRWAKRKPLVAGLMATSAALFLLGFGGVLWQWREAVAMRMEAEREAARSAQVAGFMQEMLLGVGPSVALGRDTTMLREILEKTTERLGELEAHPEVEADLRTTVGAVYAEVGQYEMAEMMHRRALEIREKLYGDEHARVAEAIRQPAHSHPEAERMFREALEMRRRLLGEKDPLVADTLTKLQSARTEETRGSRALAAFRLSWYQSARGPDSRHWPAVHSRGAAGLGPTLRGNRSPGRSRPLAQATGRAGERGSLTGRRAFALIPSVDEPASTLARRARADHRDFEPGAVAQSTRAGGRRNAAGWLLGPAWRLPDYESGATVMRMSDTLELNTRHFVRDFAKAKELARSGVSIRVTDGQDTYVFRLERQARGFLGCLKGSLASQDRPERLYSTGRKWTAES
jgi:predicted Ser/Thr protein kinase/tetratricopeptide (TPR) repeat protein